MLDRVSLGEEVAGDDLALNLAGAFVDMGGAYLSVELFEEMASFQGHRPVDLLHTLRTPLRKIWRLPCWPMRVLHLQRWADRSPPRTRSCPMGGLSVLLLAAGAILYFAIDAAMDGVDLAAVGIILMIVGAIGLIVSLLRGSFMGFSSAKSRRTVSPDGRTVVEESRVS